MVSKHSVYFFRHASVEGPQPRLEMDDWYVKLAGCEGASQRRIRVARYQNEVRRFCHHYVFERLQHSAGHLAVVAAVDPEIDTGLRDLQFVKEDPRQRRIVVL